MVLLTTVTPAILIIQTAVNQLDSEVLPLRFWNIPALKRLEVVIAGVLLQKRSKCNRVLNRICGFVLDVIQPLETIRGDGKVAVCLAGGGKLDLIGSIGIKMVHLEDGGPFGNRLAEPSGGLHQINVWCHLIWHRVGKCPQLELDVVLDVPIPGKIRLEKMAGVFDRGAEGNPVIVGNRSLDVVILEPTGDGESG